MPFYEYECAKCGYRDEVLQKITDKPLTKCPSCGKAGLRKLMSAPVFRLKGSGWYETDFKSDKENKRNLAGADPEESKSETKADTSKADAKTESPSSSDKSSSDKPATDKSGDKPADKPASKPVKPAARPKPKAKRARTTKRAARR